MEAKTQTMDKTGIISREEAYTVKQDIKQIDTSNDAIVHNLDDFRSINDSDEDLTTPYDGELENQKRAIIKKKEKNPYTNIMSDRLSWRAVADGSQGRVFHAPNTDIAIKIYNKTPCQVYLPEDTKESFDKEAEFLKLLNDTNATPEIFFAEKNGDLGYILMEYFPDSEDVKTFRRTNELSPQQTLKLAKNMAYNVSEIHKKGIIHSDIKPDNFIITDKDNLTTRVIDLGCSEYENDTSDDLALTFAYAGKERFDENYKFSKPSDIHSLGVTLHQMVTGNLPSNKMSKDCKDLLDSKITYEEFQNGNYFVPLQLPKTYILEPEMSPLIEAMTAREPEKRPTIDQVISSLENIAQQYN